MNNFGEALQHQALKLLTSATSNAATGSGRLRLKGKHSGACISYVGRSNIWSQEIMRWHFNTLIRPFTYSIAPFSILLRELMRWCVIICG